jgi:hypothetical protein
MKEIEMRPDGAWSGILVGAVAASALAAAPAHAAPFAFTGGEQTYTVPPDVASVRITAVGAGGGTPPPGSGLPAGRGAIVSGLVAVTGGQVLFVYVGGSGGLPAGGFNGGGNGAQTQDGLLSWGGGGASDVRTASGALDSRVIVAAGGGGSAGIAAAGGDAGRPGGCCGAAGTGPRTAQPGTLTAGGAGGGACASSADGCGGAGTLGRGGDGGASGAAADQRAGAGGGGGLFGGGGGAGNLTDHGAGAGGSSQVPSGGSVGVAPSLDTPSSVDIEPHTTTSNSRPAAPTVKLETMSTQLSFLFNVKRRRTRLTELRLRNVPAGSKVAVRCRTRSGGRCAGTFTRANATGTLRLRTFERRRFRTGTRIVASVTNPAFLSQVKTLTMRKRRGPATRTQCEAPATGGLTSC